MSGVLDIGTLGEARKALRKTQGSLDIGGLERLDTPGALFLCNLRDKGVKLTAVRAEHQSLLDLICGLELKPLPKVEQVSRWRQIVVELGKGAHDARHDVLDIITFLGRAASWTVSALLHPSCMRPAAISRHVEETGVHALPIIGTMAVMIAVVIGYQGVAQLRPYGGEDFTINLVAVSMLREMAVLITAIMVAGRSGSAYTAEIGVMRTRATYCSGDTSSRPKAIPAPPRRPIMSAKKVSRGRVMTSAITRGTTSTCMGSIPITLSASTSSRVFMTPISAV